jgi:hypothetical protein
MRRGMRSRRRTNRNFTQMTIQIKIIEGLLATGFLFILGMGALWGVQKANSFSSNSGLILLALLLMLPFTLLAIVLLYPSHH